MELQTLLESCSRDQLNLCDDSRKARKGDVFIAVPGATEDGSRYIRDAWEKGAAFIVGTSAARECYGDLIPDDKFVVCEDPHKALGQLAMARWHTDRLSLKIIGVTGTNGKTTSAALLEHLFEASGYKTGVLGTVTYRWPGFSREAPLTTPGLLDLHAMLHAMAAAGTEIVIMEVSSHALAQGRVDGVPFDGALFTNLTQDHLDYHKDMESYFRAKAKLFFELPKSGKAAAMNGDDVYGRRMHELLPQALSFGLHKTFDNINHLHGRILTSGVHGLELEMSWQGKKWMLSSPLVGQFNAMNLFGVQALALQMGVDTGALQALKDFHGVCGRLERVKNDRGLHIFVDYAHTPDALVNVLNALRGSGFRRIVTVFGCGGNRDKTKRPLMGEAVAALSDVAILTSDNPRFEDPDAIIGDVLPGLAKARQVFVEVDRRSATALALDVLEEDDALLIAGKGHETYQLINGQKLHYSDQEVVRELLKCD